MLPKLNRIQVESISNFFADLAKIVVGSAVVGFFVPGFGGDISTPIFISGTIISTGLFVLSVIVLKDSE